MAYQPAPHGLWNNLEKYVSRAILWRGVILQISMWKYYECVMINSGANH